ncbi:carbohydrate kinase [Cereibacter sphaeroides]|nr:carbohydrate kinase [Cereibacter sphaeroides]
MILCCGEALIDMLPVPGPGAGPAFAPHAGGAVFNTAIALGRLGAPTGFFAGIAADFLGDILRDTLAESKVDTSACVMAPRPSTLAFVKLVEGQATYAFYDENTAGRMLTEADLPAITEDAYFFGGISLVVDPCGATYEALMGRARAAGKVTMLDPNIRPGFITDEAAYRGRIDRMIGLADIVKLSLEDLAWLSGGKDEAFVQAMLERGVSLVLLTDGGVGATGVTPRGRLFEPARKVNVVDTVGAGDTFNAGVLASLNACDRLSRDSLRDLDDSTLRAALQLGAAAAAVTVSRAGANPPWPSEM